MCTFDCLLPLIDSLQLAAQVKCFGMMLDDLAAGLHPLFFLNISFSFFLSFVQMLID